LVFVSFVNCAGNPFLNTQIYTNPSYQAEVEGTIATHPDLATLLKKAEDIPAAYWIDSISRIANITAVLEGAKAKGTSELTIFVIYDLPNRDCAALASNGELVCADSTCTDALNTYRTQYIDPIVTIFKKFSGQPIVCIIEPDSLPNLATNMNLQKCQQAENAYKQGTAYAIKQLATVGPLLSQYVDAAHGGWLGWDNNRAAAAQIFKEVLNIAGGVNLIRGFATNTANYQPLGSTSSTADPCNLKSQYNQAIDESHYIQLMTQSLSSVGISGIGFVTDTSRNGVTNMRKDCSNWCNINGAGMGRRPTTDTAFTGLSNLDALIWIKTPGEADGTSDSSAPRYDAHCSSPDSFVPAPQAGAWFADYFIMLAKNSVPAL